jgi:hypothetical protein
MSYDKPVSYSGLKLYKKCPLKWKNQYIDGNREPPGKAAQRGTDLHTAIEEFFIRGTGFPTDIMPLAPWRAYMEQLTLRSPSPELELAVNVEWEPVDFNDPTAYYRGVADLHYTDNGVLHIYDWKSGRMYPEHEAQGRTYMALSPEVDAYMVHFVYIDHPLTVITHMWNAEHRKKEIEDLRKDIEVLRLDTEYKPTPHHDTCKWCPLSWRKFGGTCRAAP